MAVTDLAPRRARRLFRWWYTRLTSDACEGRAPSSPTCPRRRHRCSPRNYLPVRIALGSLMAAVPAFVAIRPHHAFYPPRG